MTPNNLVIGNVVLGENPAQENGKPFDPRLSIGQCESPRNKSLSTIQREMIFWQRHNFPNREGWVPLMGMVEELGELAHHFIKRHQGIRRNEDHEAGIRDSIADIVIYMVDFCNSEGIDLPTQVATTWDQVSKRDWKANPTHAAAIAEASVASAPSVP